MKFFCHNRTLSNATLVLMYMQTMICNSAQALFQNCLCLVCMNAGNLPLHILPVKLLPISLLRLGPILKATLFSFFFFAFKASECSFHTVHSKPRISVALSLHVSLLEFLFQFSMKVIEPVQ